MIGKEGDIVFTILVLIVGSLLIVSNIMISNSSKCNSDTLDKLNKGVLVAGTILTTASLAFGSCHVWCDCQNNLGMDIYSWGTFMLGVFMIVIGSLILKEGIKCEVIKFWSTIIISMGGLLVLMPGSYIVYGVWVRHKAKQLDLDLGKKTRREIDNENKRRLNAEERKRMAIEEGGRKGMLRGREEALQSFLSQENSDTTSLSNTENKSYKLQGIPSIFTNRDIQTNTGEFSPESNESYTIDFNFG